MFNKKIIISKHAMKRFTERNIKMTNKKGNMILQVKTDLRPLNVKKIIRINNNEYKAVTNQGKIYVLHEYDNYVLVMTVYKVDLKFRKY